MNEGEPLSDRATLYRVTLKVRPLPGHPLYWKMQFGFLLVWLFADSYDGAASTACKIVGELPYELIGEQFAVTSYAAPVTKEESGSSVVDDPSPETTEQMAIRKQLALESGLALMLIVVATGADETGFETEPL